MPSVPEQAISCFERWSGTRVVLYDLMGGFHPELESHACPWGQTLPYVIRQAPPFRAWRGRILCPTVSFQDGLPAVRKTLARVARDVAGDDGHRPRPAAGGAALRERPRDLREVRSAPRGEHAGQRARRGRVHARDPRVGVNAPDDAEVHHAGPAEVVEEPAGAREEPQVFLAPRGSADHARTLPRRRRRPTRGRLWAR